MNFNRDMATLIEAYFQDPSVRVAVTEDCGSPVRFTFDWKHNRLLAQGSARTREFAISELYHSIMATIELARRRALDATDPA